MTPIIVSIIGAAATIVAAFIGRKREQDRPGRVAREVSPDTTVEGPDLSAVVTPTPRPNFVFVAIFALGIALTALLVSLWPRKVVAPIEPPPVGCIVAASVAPPQFARGTREQWLAADGQPVPKDSEYYKITGRENVPDLRGIFLRGLNEFTPGKPRTGDYADPEGVGRSAGMDVQSDTIGSHDHTLRIGELWVVGQEGHGTRAYSPHADMPPGEKYDNRKSNPKNLNHDILVTNQNNGKETRPKNIAVYYYIRVN